MLVDWFSGQKKYPTAEYVCTALFFLLCLVHFFSQRPLWLDEVSILKNIQHLSYQEIFGPLNYAQAFPRVYLVLIKFIGSHFDYHVLSLRLLPLISMLIAYGVWLKIYKEICGYSESFLLLLFSLTCSYYFSYYAAEFKPYATDVLVVGIFCWTLLQQRGWAEKTLSWRDRAWILFLPLTLFFSYAAFLAFWPIGFNLLFLLKRRKEFWGLLGAYALLSLFSLACIYHFDLRHSWADQALMHYWDSYFICTQSVGCCVETIWEGMRRFATIWFGKGKFFMQFASFLIPLFVYSLIRHGFLPWIKQRGRIVSLESFYAVLFLQLLVLGLLRKFPFTGERITLFFAPFVLYGLAKSLSDLKPMKWLYYLFGISYIVLLIGAYGYSFVSYLMLYKA